MEWLFSASWICMHIIHINRRASLCVCQWDEVHCIRYTNTCPYSILSLTLKRSSDSMEWMDGEPATKKERKEKEMIILILWPSRTHTQAHQKQVIVKANSIKMETNRSSLLATRPILLIVYVHCTMYKSIGRVGIGRDFQLHIELYGRSLPRAHEWSE